MDTARVVVNLRKRRGVAKSAVTHLATQVDRLKSNTATLDVTRNAQQLLTKLEAATQEYKQVHLSLVDALDDEEKLVEEKAALDELLNTVDELTSELQGLIASSSKPNPDNERKALSQRLSRLQRSLTPINDSLTELESAERPEISHLKANNEQFHEYTQELVNIQLKLFSLEVDESDDLMTQHARLTKILFSFSIRLRKLLDAQNSTETSRPTNGDSKGVRLPKLEVPTFNGDILSWRNFWEQFCISVHSQANLSSAEKLVYLQQALKGGPARSTIEDLSRSGDNYEEAVRCLKAKYDRPRRIHQAHVRAILEAPSLRDGNGKEIRKLHDTVLQHLHALRSMGYDPSGQFVTSALE